MFRNDTADTATQTRSVVVLCLRSDKDLCVTSVSSAPSICLTSLTVPDFYMTDLQDQVERAKVLEKERRTAESEAARLEEMRQAILLEKEKFAREADNQLKSKEQLVGILMALFNNFIHICTSSTFTRET